MTQPEDPYGTPAEHPAPPSSPQPPQPPPAGAQPPPPQYGQPAQPGQPEYGQPPQYGQPAPGYAPPTAGYGQPPTGYGQGSTGQLALWGHRFVGGFIDYAIFGIVAGIFRPVSYGLYLLLSLAGLVWTIYNKVIEGQTGQSIGKRVAGTRLIRESDGQNVGPGLAIARWLAHILDSLACLIGWFWPLWDSKRQTFADKICSTVVLKV